jgi:hypothetical protein
VKPQTLLLCLLLIPALACSTTSMAENLVPSGGVLYQDFFGNPQSGWGELTSPAGTASYSNGAYHILLKQPNVDLWSHPGKDFGNVHEEVSLMTATGPLANRMGLICRLQDDKNFYFFAISADGTFGIGKLKNGQIFLLTGNKMQPHTAILTGNQVNHLRADCVDDKLIMFVNGVMVSSTKDSDFTSGDVGLLAGSFEQPGSDIYFDNFVVFKP